MHAGDLVTLLVSGPLEMFASVAQPVAATVDGVAVQLAPSEVPFREYQVEFDGVAGAWVHAEVIGPAGDLFQGPRLLGPQGRIFVRSDYWHIPTTGRYRLMVPTAPMTLDDGVLYRLSSHAATATGGWQAIASLQAELHCPRRSLGCGDLTYGSVSPSQHTSVLTFGGYQAMAPWMVMLQPAPGVSASVELSVAPAV
jgi:hypothetical protein